MPNNFTKKYASKDGVKVYIILNKQTLWCSVFNLKYSKLINVFKTSFFTSNGCWVFMYFFVDKYYCLLGIKYAQISLF